MAETLGYLCDKLTILKLKQWHTTDQARLDSLHQQTNQLQNEINEWVQAAVTGQIPIERLTFAGNKVFKKEGNEVAPPMGQIGETVAQLARVNCDLWHQQEKVYEFEKVPPWEKDEVVKKLARLNIERNHCIDRLDHLFSEMVLSLQKTASCPDS